MIKKQRKSGIELLKIIAMFLIVVAHTAQNAEHLNLAELPLNQATLNIQNFIMAWLIHFGSLGNYLFIICSAWFLIGNEKSNKKKMMTLIADTFMISVLYLAGFILYNPHLISAKDFVKALMPVTFQNNWFVTAYILFLLILPFLNKIIQSISQRQLLRLNIVMIFLYWIVGFIKKEHFFFSKLFIFIGLFFIVAYIKLYMPDFFDNLNKNIICLTIGTIGFILWLSATDIIGLKISSLNNKLLIWWSDMNPFHLLTAISLFNLFRNFQFTNKGVNLISSLTLYIYLIHENVLFKNYLAPHIWNMLIEKFTVNKILAEEFVFASLVFIASILLALLYKFTVGRFTGFISGKIYNSGKLRKAFNKFEAKILNIK